MNSTSLNPHIYLKEVMVLRVILNIPNKKYASKLMTQGFFFILKNKIDQNDLTNEEKTVIYEYLIEGLRERE